jgi:hypothetical protein
MDSEDACPSIIKKDTKKGWNKSSSPWKMVGVDGLEPPTPSV